MSKFGLEIRNQCYFTISNERFMQEIGIAEGFTRRREKDLIYFPLDKRCYQIFYVENKWPAFYGLGILPAFKLTCELFEQARNAARLVFPVLTVSTNRHRTCMNGVIRTLTGFPIPIRPETSS